MQNKYSMELIGLLFSLFVLIFSVIVHEVSHGFVAYFLGDHTAEQEGRLTLNPIPHLDLFGSILLPILFYFSTGGIFGWAKPVPYNPNNLKNPKIGGAIIAVAGPLSNVFLAVLFAFLLRVVPSFYPSSELLSAFATIIYTNILLAVFNLVPIPPLDGSKVLFAFLPNNSTGWKIQGFMEQFGIFFLLVFILWGFTIIQPIIQRIFYLLTG